jgi:hypothetical protein
MLFYIDAMKGERYRHILHILQFTDKNESDRKDEMLTDWKIRNLFEIPNRPFSKFYNHSQHVAVYKVLVFTEEGSFSDNTYHLFDLAILFSYILLSSCGGKKISHRDF